MVNRGGPVIAIVFPTRRCAQKAGFSPERRASLLEARTPSAATYREIQGPESRPPAAKYLGLERLSPPSDRLRFGPVSSPNVPLLPKAPLDLLGILPEIKNRMNDNPV
jgi:hypothetical protein